MTPLIMAAIEQQTKKIFANNVEIFNAGNDKALAIMVISLTYQISECRAPDEFAWSTSADGE